MPENVCRKGLKFPEIPGNEVYLVALRATFTVNYIQVLTPAQVINSLGRGNFLGPISDYVWGLLYVRDERFLIK